ncbi:MAG: hypothetical protein IJQ08_10955, partial [Synergistaceae bacterium]|nr:hypothetical protein [Synergistaceae bacterium]
MKRNIWYSVLVIAFVVFAVISAGGCGGSSGDPVKIESTPDNPDNPDNPSNPLSELIGGSDLVSVYGTEEYVNMVKEFQASGSFDKMNEIYMIF